MFFKRTELYFSLQNFTSIIQDVKIKSIFSPYALNSILFPQQLEKKWLPYYRPDQMVNGQKISKKKVVEISQQFITLQLIN